MKQRLVVLLGALMMVMLAACGGGDDSGDAGGDTTLQIGLWDENLKDVIDQNIARFEEENPGVTVEVTYTPWADYWTKLRTNLAGGGGPDVFWMNGPNIYQYASSGLIKDIQPFIDEEDLDTTVFNDSLVELYTYEDSMYGLPTFLDTIGLFYNKALFDEAGVDYPTADWTWDDLEEAAEQLTDEEKGQYGYIAFNSEQAGYYNLILQNGGYIISDDKTTSGMGSPEALEAMEWMQMMLDQMYSPSIQTQIETEPNQIFGSRKAAMLPNISVNTPYLYEMLGDDLGIAPLPAGKEKAAIVHGLSWVMNAQTEHEELAWKLMKSLTDEEAGKLMAESGFSIPAYKGTEDAWVESIPGLDLQVFIDTLEFGVPYPVSEQTAEWQTIEQTEIESALLGNQPLDEALKKVEEGMNEILAEEQADE
ncbi:sugar ABC transporter substrate-binding protein [Bacillaceae bacterium SIJ1]|uniref:ABC transporter substrate-binding protein n=1 Tax=Litoribacterium kuwaitense TaxID=1398745 RepID=UPI0013ECAE91|nr:sugar ABC transporter substrate-binding protein [Litoribacterium kuwaitense]NGP45938.1 sugar ABC transporter substrate-binding protein [Litoribacterium kuwaitense]